MNIASRFSRRTVYRSNGEKMGANVSSRLLVPWRRTRKKSVLLLISLLSMPCTLKEMISDLLSGLIFILGDCTKLGKRSR